MEKITRRGVYKDLSISPFRIEYLGHEFVFSSECKLEKFVKDATAITQSLEKIEGKLFSYDKNNKKFLNHDKLLEQSILGLYERCKK